MSSTSTVRNADASDRAENQQIDNRVQESITQLAYALWERRGRPEGSSEEDWRIAEQEVRSQAATAGR